MQIYGVEVECRAEQSRCFQICILNKHTYKYKTQNDKANSHKFACLLGGHKSQLMIMYCNQITSRLMHLHL